MRKLFVTFFGLGYGPIAPATWGSFGTILVYFAACYALGRVPPPWWVVLIGILAACVLCVAFGDWAIAYYHSNDPKPVVIDEVAGQWLSVLLVPTGGSVKDLIIVCAAAFVLFRVFDILKLPPARQLERLPAGWGILCDDLAAGIQANIVLQIIFRWHLFGAF